MKITVNIHEMMYTLGLGPITESLHQQWILVIMSLTITFRKWNILAYQGLWPSIRELSFFTGRGGVCLQWPVANFFWSPPLAYVKKFWSPLGKRKKILVPPLPLWKNSGPSPLDERTSSSHKQWWGAVIKWRCVGVRKKMWSYMNMLYGMNCAKGKSCAEGAENLWIMYFRRNCAKGAKKKN